MISSQNAVPTTTTGWIERPEGRLAYEVTGTGPLVVASPGIGDLRQSFRFLAADLVAAGHRVAVLDLRGHGGSDTGWSSYTDQAVAGDLVATALQLAAPGERAVLVGNSASGAAAVLAAAARPDLVAALVLSGAFVRTVPSGPATRATVWVMTRTPLGRPLWTTYFPSLFPGRKPADFREYLAALRANLREPGRWAAVAAMFSGDHDAVEAALPRVTAPTLVVMGGADPDFPDPAAEAQLTADRLTGLATPARVVLVDGAGHYPHVERPDLVSPEVVAFLAGLPSAGTA